MIRNLEWFTGLFEGEGCIQIKQSPSIKKEYPVYLTIQMTDEDVIASIPEIVGGKTCGPLGPYGTNKKPSWRWQLIAKPLVKELLEKMLPLLGIRRRNKALEALRYIEEHPRPVDKKFCKNGHKRNKENVTIRKNGKKYCRPCQSLYDRRRRK